MMRTGWFIIPVTLLGLACWLSLGSAAFASTGAGFHFTIWDFLALHARPLAGGLIGAGVPVAITMLAVWEFI